MLPDSLHGDLPELIATRAREVLQEGEQLQAVAVSKVGWAWMPYVVLPGSCYLALTDQRVIGFLATSVKALPGAVWFERPRNQVRAATRDQQILVTLENGRTRTLHLSPTHRQSSNDLLNALQ